MALTKVKDVCLICERKMVSGDKAFFLGGVELTNADVKQYDYGWPQREGKVREGKLRILHRVGMKPRGIICLECIEKIFSE